MPTPSPKVLYPPQLEQRSPPPCRTHFLDTIRVGIIKSGPHAMNPRRILAQPKPVWPDLNATTAPIMAVLASNTTTATTWPASVSAKTKKCTTLCLALNWYTVDEQKIPL